MSEEQPHQEKNETKAPNENAPAPVENAPVEIKKEGSTDKDQKPTPMSISSRKNKPNFVLDGMRVNSKLVPYNGLIDRHLETYFSNDKLRDHLHKMGLITDSGHIIEGKKKKIRKVNKVEGDIQNESSRKIQHRNSLENEYIDKLPKLANCHNDSNVMLPKIYLTNLKIEANTGRETGTMPETKKIKDNSFSNNHTNNLNIYKKKPVHNHTKLDSLSKDELTKVFMKYRAKVSSEIDTENANNNYNPSVKLNDQGRIKEKSKEPPKVPKKESLKEQPPKIKEQPTSPEKALEEHLPNEQSPIKDQTIKDQPIKDQSIKDQSIKDQTNKDQPTKDQPIKEEQIKEEPIKEKPNQGVGSTKKASIDKTNELPVKKDSIIQKKFSLTNNMKQGSQKNIENGIENKKEEIKEHVEEKPGDMKKEQSPIKENEKIEESPMKHDPKADGKEYDEEIFEEDNVKN